MSSEWDKVFQLIRSWGPSPQEAGLLNQLEVTFRSNSDDLHALLQKQVPVVPKVYYFDQWRKNSTSQPYNCLFCGWDIAPANVATHLDAHAKENVYLQSLERKTRRPIQKWEGWFASPDGGSLTAANDSDRVVRVEAPGERSATLLQASEFPASWTASFPSSCVKEECLCTTCCMCLERLPNPVWDEEREAFILPNVMNLMEKEGVFFMAHFAYGEWWKDVGCKHAPSKCEPLITDWMVGIRESSGRSTLCRDKQCYYLCDGCILSHSLQFHEKTCKKGG